MRLVVTVYTGAHLSPASGPGSRLRQTEGKPRESEDPEQLPVGGLREKSKRQGHERVSPVHLNVTRSQQGQARRRTQAGTRLLTPVYLAAWERCSQPA